jgi:hypothetical protein
MRTMMLNERKRRILTMSFTGSGRFSCSRWIQALQMAEMESNSTVQSKNESFVKVCAWLSSSCFINDWLAGLLSSGALIESEDSGDADDFKRVRIEERGDVEEAVVSPGRVSSAKCRR